MNGHRGIFYICITCTLSPSRKTWYKAVRWDLLSATAHPARPLPEILSSGFNHRCKRSGGQIKGDSASQRRAGLTAVQDLTDRTRTLALLPSLRRSSRVRDLPSPRTRASGNLVRGTSQPTVRYRRVDDAPSTDETTLLSELRYSVQRDSALM